MIPLFLIHEAQHILVGPILDWGWGLVAVWLVAVGVVLILLGLLEK